MARGTDIGRDGAPEMASPPTEDRRRRLHAQQSDAHAGPDELQALLVDIISAAQHTYPTISVPPAVFAAYLGERLSAGVAPRAALRQLHVADLYLACACARGDVRGFAAFEDHCLSQLDSVLRRMGIGADLIAEVKQDIRHRVLVGDGKRAQISDFAGRGDLRAWVRVMAVRQALRRVGRARREASQDDDELLRRIAAPGNPELDYMKAAYRAEFKQAFEGALQALSDRERTLLCQHYVDALTIDQLATLYGMHRSTAARLLASARAAVLDATRARMMSRLDVQPADLDSILRMIQSRLAISFGAMRRRRKR